MIGATYPVLASAGSDRNLSRSLSPVVPVVAETPSATPRRQRFPYGSPSLTFHRAVSRAPLRAISRKKPFNTQRLVPAPFNEFYPKRSGPTIRCPTPFFRRSTSDRILFIIGLYSTLA